MDNSMAKSKVFPVVIGFAKPFIIALALIIAMMVSGFHVVTVYGASMDSTLQSGEKIVVTNFCYTPQCGDIVVINENDSLNKNIIKRVIAVEGQSIKLDYENDKIYVDGKELYEPYLKCSTFGGQRANYEIPSVVPEGKVFVLGDNRGISLDSRDSSVGFVDVKDIFGKAQFTVFPFDRLGGFDS